MRGILKTHEGEKARGRCYPLGSLLLALGWTMTHFLYPGHLMSGSPFLQLYLSSHSSDFCLSTRPCWGLEQLTLPAIANLSVQAYWVPLSLAYTVTDGSLATSPFIPCRASFLPAAEAGVGVDSRLSGAGKPHTQRRDPFPGPCVRK